MITEVEFGKRLRTQRESKQLTQADVAHAMDVAVTTVQRLEAGTLNPTLRTILNYCENVGIIDIFPTSDEESASMLPLLQRCTPSQLDAIRAVLLGFVINHEKTNHGQSSEPSHKLRKPGQKD